MRVLCLMPVALAAAAAPASPPPSWGKCAGCHANVRGGAAEMGPNLWGVAGMRAGGRAGFAYSAALKRTGLVWTKVSLTRWLASPHVVAPGTTMPPVPLTPAERDELVGYLLRLK